MTIDLFRTRLLATTMICSAIGMPAFAQVAAPTAAADETAAGDDQLIVVTGSLIRNPNLVSASPVNVIGEDELNLRQTSVAEDLLRQLPGVVPSIGSAVNNGNGGASFVDLRALGNNRNIVLLDGVRLTPTDTVGRFDLNNVPVSLIQRTDILTGGASTTYGADAVAGVINFITKSDFSGVEIQAQNGITGKGDGNRVRFDVTVGANTDDGRGNVVLSVGYQNIDPVYQGAREISREQYNSFNGAAGGSGTSVPSRFAVINPLGRDNIAIDCNAANGSGEQIAGRPTCSINQGTRQINPAGTGFNTGGGFIPFNFNPFNIFQTPFERYNIYGAARYEVADNVEVYTRGVFSKNVVNTIIAPSGAFAIPVSINLNNPFLTPALRNGFCQADQNAGLGYEPLLTRAECDDAAAPGLRPNDPDYQEVETTLFRRSVEVGPRVSTFETTFFDYRVGVRGKVTDTIEFDVAGAYGESRRDNFQTGYTTNDAFAQATRAVRNADGTIGCIDPSNGCVAADLFSGGVGGGLSAGTVDFLSASARDVTNVSLGQIRATFTGEVPVASPFSSSNVSFAAGAEYRDYTAEILPDFLTERGLLGGSGGPTTPVSGGYEVYEGFGEVQIPLVEDRPFFKSLTVGGGVRYSAYSVNAPSRPTYDTLTWKAEGSWEPVDGVRLRGNYSFASRAPNIAELFTPQSTGLTNLADDPCANIDDEGLQIDGRPVPTGALRDVCLAQIGTQNAASLLGSIAVPTAGQANTTGGGSLNVRPEDSISWTVGGVLAPRQIPGLSITVDYFNIVVTDAITSPTPADALFSCFGPGNVSVSNPACVGPTGIGRNPGTGQLSGDASTTRGLFQTTSNQGRLETDGIDLSVNYQRDLGPVKFAYSFVGTWTNNIKFQATASGINRQCVGQYSTNCAGNGISNGSIVPEFQWNQRTTFSALGVDLSLLWRHTDPVRYEELLPTIPVIFGGTGVPFSGTLTNGPFAGETVNFGRIPSYNYFDLSLRFSVTENTSLNFLVENLTDVDPPLVGNTIGSTTFNSGNTYPSTYDALGRRFSVSARVRF